ncbi:hypothetical protein PPL_00685 [Heterostelium album PN500]|uniref:Ankyrin repeat-containing protein n=1 Tax=Heterostelium pallidum (strain ATCC 26659 / Pp 5 / PN500) TaxID=670386 RepID=D3AX56_HETP5|nr:hypothetical protein PPL_00685 [Heterostelium album PN500]EFA86125.1 hypothetical protein PPL_00685 [Heterostelium album PN500]|eukprot:XP_020438230.1 hypothetical protein PPL_00685 [Heterostelium album PN500]
MKIFAIICIFLLTEKITKRNFDEYINMKYYRWCDVITSPEVMAGNGLLEQLVSYFKVNPIETLDQYRQFKSLRNSIYSKHNGLEILCYFIRVLKVDELVLTGKFTSLPLVDKGKDIYYFASKFGRLDILRYLDDQTTDIIPYKWDRPAAFRVAPLSNDIEVLKYIANVIDKEQQQQKQQRRQQPDKPQNQLLTYFNVKDENSVVYNNAATMGRIDMIEWLAEHRPEFRLGSDMYMAAVSNDNLELLEYLKSQQAKYSVKSSDQLLQLAAIKGCSQAMMWLLQNNIGTVTPTVISYAAGRTSNTDLIKWFYENGYSRLFPPYILNTAVEIGNLELLRWLNECVVPIHNNLPATTRVNKNKILPCSNSSFIKAVLEGRLEVVRYLTDHCHDMVKQQQTYYRLPYNGNLEMIQWITENRPNDRFSNDVIEEAASKGYLDILTCFHNTNRYEVCTSETIKNASINGHLDTVRYLLENTNNTTTEPLKQINLQLVTNEAIKQLLINHLNTIQQQQ